MGKPPRLMQIRRNFSSKDTLAFRVITLIRNTLMRSTNEDNNKYFYLPEDSADYRTDMDDDHDFNADIDSDTLIRIVKFLKRGRAPGPSNIHNEVLGLGTTTSLFHHSARLFTSSMQIGYIPAAWKLATLRMLLKPDKLLFLTSSYRPISLMSSILL